MNSTVSRAIGILSAVTLVVAGGPVYAAPVVVEAPCSSNSYHPTLKRAGVDESGRSIEVITDCPTGKISRFFITVKNWQQGQAFCVNVNRSLWREYRLFNTTQGQFEGRFESDWPTSIVVTDC